MSLTRVVAYNTLVQVLGKATTTAISLVLIGTLTRYLGVSGYGQYTTIFAYIAFFGVLADFGFFWILVREIAKKELPIEKIANNLLTFRAVIAIGVYLLAYLIAQFLPYPHLIKVGIGLAAATTFWLTLNTTLVGVFQSQLRMDKAVVTDVVSRLVILGVVLFIIKVGGGLLAVILAYLTGNLVNFWLSFLLARKYLRIYPAFDFYLWRKIISEAWPMGVVLILGVIYFRIDTVILSLLKGPIDVGIYGAPYKILEILTTFPAMFMGSVFPILTGYLKERDPRLPLAFQKSFDFLAIGAIPIIVGVWFLAGKIMRFVAGSDFASAFTLSFRNLPLTPSSVLQILIIAVGISFLSHLFVYSIIALGKQKSLIWPNLGVVILNVSLNLIFIPRYSYLAAALVTVLSEFLLLVLVGLLVYNALNFLPRFLIIFKAGIGSAIMAIFLYYFPGLNLGVSIILATLIYFFALYLIKGINKEMILAIIRR